jgi:hypothetical protein
MSAINALANALSNVSLSSKSSAIAPVPGPGQPNASKAIKRCCAAWQRAYNAKMKDPANTICPEFDAAEAARNAYRGAMPVLAGYDGIRDFVACAAHGILIGAIPNENSSQLLYAAQVAISTLLREPKSRRKHPADTQRQSATSHPSRHTSSKA